MHSVNRGGGQSGVTEDPSALPPNHLSLSPVWGPGLRAGQILQEEKKYQLFFHFYCFGFLFCILYTFDYSLNHWLFINGCVMFVVVDLNHFFFLRIYINKPFNFFVFGAPFSVFVLSYSLQPHSQ